MKRIITNHALVASLALVINIALLEIFIQSFPQNKMIPSFMQNIVPGITTVEFGIKNSLRNNINSEATNSLGYKFSIKTNEKHIRRATAINYVKSKNIFRILILGDSITFGQGVENTQTFSFYLEKLLNEKNIGMKFEVLNGGVPDWGLIEYYFFLKNEGYKYNPDLVILALESSDPETLKTELIKFDRSYTQKTGNSSQTYLEEPQVIPIEISFLEFLTSKIVDNSLYAFLTSNSHMINLFRWRFNQFLDSMSSAKRSDDELNRHPFEDSHPGKWIIKENGREKSVSGAFGFKYVGAKILIEKMQKFSEDKGFKFLTFQLPYHFRVLDKLLASINLKELIPRTSVLAPLQKVRSFQEQSFIPLFMPGDIHLIPSGHKLIAYILYNFLATSSEFKFSFSKKLIPFEQSRIYDAILQSEIRFVNIVKSYPFWEFTKAMIYKNRNQFKKSKLAFLRFLEMEPESPQGNFHLSALLIKEGNMEKAIPYLEKLTLSKNIFQKQASNILALNYLKQGDIEMANFYKKGSSANKNFQNSLKRRLGVLGTP